MMLYYDKNYTNTQTKVVRIFSTIYEDNYVLNFVPIVSAISNSYSKTIRPELLETTILQTTLIPEY